jgi:hypothetical protein
MAFFQSLEIAALLIVMSNIRARYGITYTYYITIKADLSSQEMTGLYNNGAGENGNIVMIRVTFSALEKKYSSVGTVTTGMRIALVPEPFSCTNNTA